MQAWRIAVSEVRRQAGRTDPRVALAVLVLGALIGVAVVAWQPSPPDPDAGLYRVHADDGAPLHDAVARDARFRLVDDGWDLRLTADHVIYQDTERGKAAYEALVDAVRDWQDGILEHEADQPAAFPLQITLAYEPRSVDPATTPPAPTPRGSTDRPAAGDAPVLDQADPEGPVQEDLRPDQVDPPFPIRSLLLTFAYVLPASLLAQVHASNLHAERTRHRGLLLLSAPVSPTAFILGKSLPGLAVNVVLAAVVTLILGAGWLGFLASLSFLGFLFAATSFLALISRSPRELSLLQVASTTLLNVFLFLPAMFPSIEPVAFLSPIHVVASGIRGDPVTLGQFAYAVLPLSLAALALGALAVGLARDELMFSVRSSVRRLLGAIAAVTPDRTRLAAAGALVVPFVFAAEILVLVLASVLGLQAAFFAWLPLSVLLEESAKGLAVWSRPMRPRPWLTGLLVGTGFFVGEKGYLVLTLVGFRDLPFGQEALAILGTGPGPFLLMLPLALHVATSILLAWSAARGKAVWGFLAAYLVHLGYDQLLLGGAL